MKKSTPSFQLFLKEELQRRSKNNKYYSIRAYARDLGINDSTLSKLLVGKLKISAKRVQFLGKQLGLSQKKIEEYITTLNSRYTSSVELGFKQLQLDQFNCASDWYHDAIIELAKIDNIDPKPQNIAQLLDISFLQAQDAIERLLRLNLVSISECGYLKCELEHSLTNYDEKVYTNDLLKQYQKQILNQSIKAVEKSPREKRCHNSMILSLDSSKLDEFHDLMRKQQKELLSFMEESSSKPDTVYAVQLASFPLSKVTVS